MNIKSYERHKEHAFDCYCKKIIKNEARNIYTDKWWRYNGDYHEFTRKTKKYNHILVLF